MNNQLKPRMHYLFPIMNVARVPRECIHIPTVLLAVVCQCSVLAGEAIQPLGVLPRNSRYEVTVAPGWQDTYAFRDGRLYIDDGANGTACESQTLAGHQGWSSRQSLGQDRVRYLYWYFQGDALLGLYDYQKPVTGFGGTDGIVRCMYGWRDGAPTPAACLDQAVAAIAARRPQEAIPLLQAIIEFDRNELPLSVPAVQALVQAFQMIKDQPGMEQRYRDLVGRYVSAVPPLDGAARPDPAVVEEDLLWKSWYPGRLSRVETYIHDQGVIQHSGYVNVNIKLSGEGRMRLINTHPPEAVAGVMLGDTHADSFPIPDKQLRVSGTNSALVLFSFPVTIPRGSLLPPLSFRLRLSQASRSSVQRVLIKPGVAWKNEGGTGIVESLSQIGDEWKLVTKEEGVAVLKMSVFDANGRELSSSGSSESESENDDGPRYVVRDFPTQPVSLELTTVDRVSTRDIPFTVNGITVK